MHLTIFASAVAVLGQTTTGVSFEHGLIWSVVFGVIGIALAVLGFKVFDWITPRIDVEKELAEKQNVAVAIVCGSMIIGICIIVARAIGS
jgi:putative membrane protein